MKKCPVSVVLAVFNEEAFIEESLKSVLWAEEIIVIDGGSTDKTPEIVRRYTDKLFIEQNGPAETQRLKGVKRISCPWFLLLDADERVDERLRDSIIQATADSGPFTCYRVLRRNYRMRKPVHLHHPDFQVRLFRATETVSLPDKIHRAPSPQGSMGTLGGELRHLFFTDWGLYQKKFDFYTDLEARYWCDSGRRLGGVDACKRLWLRPVGRFLQYFFLRKGILDGGFGFKYAWKSACYERAVAQKIMDAQKRSRSCAQQR